MEVFTRVKKKKKSPATTHQQVSLYIPPYFKLENRQMVNCVYLHSALLPSLEAQSTLQSLSHSPMHIHIDTICCLKLAPITTRSNSLATYVSIQGWVGWEPNLRSFNQRLTALIIIIIIIIMIMDFVFQTLKAVPMCPLVIHA